MLAHVGLCWNGGLLQVGTGSQSRANSVGPCWHVVWVSKLAPVANPKLILLAYVGTMLGSKLAPRANPHLVLLAYVGPCWAYGGTMLGSNLAPIANVPRLDPCWHHVGLQVGSESQSTPNSVGPCWTHVDPVGSESQSPPNSVGLVLAYVGTMLSSKLAPRGNPHLILLAHVGPVLAYVCIIMLG